MAAPREGTVSLLDLAASKEIERLPALGADVGTVAYSPDGTLLVSGSGSGTIRVWSCAEHHLLRELGDPNIPIYLVNFRADGRWLLSVDRKGKAMWWVNEGKDYPRSGCRSRTRCGCQQARAEAERTAFDDLWPLGLVVTYPWVLSVPPCCELGPV